jgi:hypothetical protein
MTISYQDFEKVDLRSGTITYKIWADFGKEIGIL